MHAMNDRLFSRCPALLAMACAIALAPLPVFAANTSADFAVARTQFEAGRAGSPDATGRAQQLLAHLLKSDADNPLYLAYYGSTFALQARDARLPWTKINLINQGNAMIDHALSLLDRQQSAASAPSALETRLVAIATFVALPEGLFHRLGPARREYQKALASPAFATASHDLQGHLEFEGALIARQDGDAGTERTTLQRVLALAPPSVDLAEVRARLADLH